MLKFWKEIAKSSIFLLSSIKTLANLWRLLIFQRKANTLLYCQWRELQKKWLKARLNVLKYKWRILKSKTFRFWRWNWRKNNCWTKEKLIQERIIFSTWQWNGNSLVQLPRLMKRISLSKPRLLSSWENLTNLSLLNEKILFKSLIYFNKNSFLSS